MASVLDAQVWQKGITQKRLTYRKEHLVYTNKRVKNHHSIQNRYSERKIRTFCPRPNQISFKRQKTDHEINESYQWINFKTRAEKCVCVCVCRRMWWTISSCSLRKVGGSQVNEVHQDADVHLCAGPTFYSAPRSHFHHRGSVGPTWQTGNDLRTSTHVRVHARAHTHTHASCSFPLFSSNLSSALPVCLLSH